MNWLDLVITICIGIGFIKGLFDGIIKQVISLISLILAIAFAGRAAQPIREFLLKQSFINDIFPPYIITGICYILAFALIIIGFYWLGKLLNDVINVTPAKLLNSLLGGFFGIFVWIFTLSLAFNLLTVFDPNSHIISKQTQRESVLYTGVKGTILIIYPYVKHYFFDKNSAEDKTYSV